MPIRDSSHSSTPVRTKTHRAKFHIPFRLPAWLPIVSTSSRCPGSCVLYSIMVVLDRVTYYGPPPSVLYVCCSSGDKSWSSDVEVELAVMIILSKDCSGRVCHWRVVFVAWPLEWPVVCSTGK